MKLVAFDAGFTKYLNKENEWIMLSEILPWHLLEKMYEKNFSHSGTGAPALSVRFAFGALLIQAKSGYTDREVVAQIAQNPYYQYFLGLQCFHTQPLFSPATMVNYRKRFGIEDTDDSNEAIIEICQQLLDQVKKTTENQKQEETKEEPSDNQGTLILDATCVPQDIRYPTDLSLLNEAREKLEEMIDHLHRHALKKKKKPRTYRYIARKEYLNVAKKPGSPKKAVRKAIKKQLGYVRRNLKTIDTMLGEQEEIRLTSKQQEELETIRKLYSQQKYMYENKTHICENRIVSIHQPYVRPIKRGKAKNPTEFGPKLAISLTEGFVRIEKLSWDNFNEGITLQESVERYRQRYGYYPQRILADKLYRTRDNLKYCKKNGIHLTGPRLGRKTAEMAKEEAKIMLQDSKDRNAVEGKIGEGKRGYTLDLIKGKSQRTNQTKIGFELIAMNICHFLRKLRGNQRLACQWC